MNKLITQESADNWFGEPDRLRDGDSGLYLGPSGSMDFPWFKTWYINALDYHLFDDKYNWIEIGKYPGMSLAQARTAYLEYLTNIRNEVTLKIQYELDKVKPTHIIDGQEYKQLELKE